LTHRQSLAIFLYGKINLLILKVIGVNVIILYPWEYKIAD